MMLLLENGDMIFSFDLWHENSFRKLASDPCLQGPRGQTVKPFLAPNYGTIFGRRI